MCSPVFPCLFGKFCTMWAGIDPMCLTQTKQAKVVSVRWRDFAAAAAATLEETPSLVHATRVSRRKPLPPLHGGGCRTSSKGKKTVRKVITSPSFKVRLGQKEVQSKTTAKENTSYLHRGQKRTGRMSTPGAFGHARWSLGACSDAAGAKIR